MEFDDDNIIINLDTIESVEDIKIIVVDHISHEHCNQMDESITYNYVTFQLLSIIGLRTAGASHHWHGHIYSRHGSFYNGWWFDDREMNVPIQLDNLPDTLPYNDKYLFCYVRVNNPDMLRFRDQFLENLGGQSHVQCSRHKLPLIASTTQSNKCQCGRK